MNLRDLIKTDPSTTRIIPIPRQNACYRYDGNSHCGFCTEQTLKIIEVAALMVYCKFPNRVDRQLSIGDGCLQDGSTAPGHTSHARGHRIDFNYFTFGRNNTQYGKPIQTIWHDEHRARILKTDTFDWERNFYFWYYICDMLPLSDVLVSTRIMEYIVGMASTNYPSEWKQIKSNIRDTGWTTWRHHTHVHIDFGAWDRDTGMVIDWDKPRKWLTCK